LAALAPSAGRAQDPSPTPTPPPAPAAEAPPAPDAVPRDQIPLTDRWRIGFPDWSRRVRGKLFDPYNQNPLKGDYAIPGTQSTFFVLTGVLDVHADSQRLPVPSDVSSARPDSEEFFGRGETFAGVGQAIVTLDLFHGSTAYKPVDWELRVTGVGNLNYLSTRENGIVNIDPTRGTDRTDRHASLQEAFGEVRLATISPNFDFVSLRAGIQGFTSDFRGFVFVDQNLGARLFGNFASNRYQWNLAVFDQLEKDTNSGLNTFERRRQQVSVANLYMQDFAGILGYTMQLSFHWNRDRGERHLDRNGFPVRPALIGTSRDHEQDAYYAGWTSDGHIGRINVNHAFYQLFGHDTFDPIAGRRVTLDGRLGALELSYDRDWMRYKISGFYQSGDRSPDDDTASGFDSILDDVNFAGGPFSFWNRQQIRLTQTGVALTNKHSLLADFKASKDEGMSEYVNPGVFLLNAGMTAKLTPKLVAEANVNWIRFDTTAPLEYVLFQPSIPHEVGWDASLGFRYRPFLNDNVVVVLGGALFFPGAGFKEIYSSSCQTFQCGASSKTLYQGFAALTLVY
jgi:hypothetical protein